MKLYNYRSINSIIAIQQKDMLIVVKKQWDKFEKNEIIILTKSDQFIDTLEYLYYIY